MQSLHNKSLFKNFPLIINMLISLHGSSPSLPGGGKQLTRVMGAPWPQFGAVCSSSPLFWDELWNIVFLPWTRHSSCPLVYVLALSFFFFSWPSGYPFRNLLALEGLSGDKWQGWEVLLSVPWLCMCHVHKGSQGTRGNCEAWKRGTL